MATIEVRARLATAMPEDLASIATKYLGLSGAVVKDKDKRSVAVKGKVG